MAKPKKPKKMNHNDLVNKLFEHLQSDDTVTLPEHRLFRSYGDGNAIADIYQFNKSYRKTNYRVFEVKVREADLMGDYTSCKYEKYLKFCEKFYYVFPKGMVDHKKLIIDPRIGIMTYNEETNHFHTSRAAKPHGKMAAATEDWALCLAFGRFTNEKLQEIRSLENTKLNLLKGEVSRLVYDGHLDNVLKNKCEELTRREQKVERIEQGAKAAAMKEIKDRMGSKFWRRDPQGIILNMFEEPLQEAVNQVKNNIEKMISLEGEYQ